MSQVAIEAHPPVSSTGPQEQASPENAYSAHTIALSEWLTQEEEERRIGAEKAARVGKPPLQQTLKRVKILPEPLPEIDLGDKNWVGLLLEYRNAHPHLIPTTITEDSIGLQRFICTVTIAETTEVFGSLTMGFGSKKDAKRHACKCAIEWLMQNNFMPTDGGVRFLNKDKIPAVTIPKVSILGAPRRSNDPAISPTSPPPSESTLTGASPTSYAQRVAQLSVQLGFSPPTYIATQEDASAPSIWTFKASFPGDARVHGEVGECRNVFGKKNAKEQCAKLVVAWLEAVRDRRVKEMQSFVGKEEGGNAEEVREGEGAKRKRGVDVDDDGVKDAEGEVKGEKEKEEKISM